VDPTRLPCYLIYHNNILKEQKLSYRAQEVNSKRMLYGSQVNSIFATFNNWGPCPGCGHKTIYPAPTWSPRHPSWQSCYPIICFCKPVLDPWWFGYLFDQGSYRRTSEDYPRCHWFVDVVWQLLSSDGSIRRLQGWLERGKSETD
jgi:hypothetical protein